MEVIGGPEMKCTYFHRDYWTSHVIENIRVKTFTIRIVKDNMFFINAFFPQNFLFKKRHKQLWSHPSLLSFLSTGPGWPCRLQIQVAAAPAWVQQTGGFSRWSTTDIRWVSQWVIESVSGARNQWVIESISESVKGRVNAWVRELVNESSVIMWVSQSVS